LNSWPRDQTNLVVRGIPSIKRLSSQGISKTLRVPMKTATLQLTKPGMFFLLILLFVLGPSTAVHAQTTTLTMSATDPDASELGANHGTFIVTRDNVTGTALTVNYTVGGTTTASNDYQNLPSSVTIPGNQASATMTVTPLDDGSAETAQSVIALRFSTHQDDGTPTVRRETRRAVPTDRPPGMTGLEMSEMSFGFCASAG